MWRQTSQSNSKSIKAKKKDHRRVVSEVEFYFQISQRNENFPYESIQFLQIE